MQEVFVLNDAKDWKCERERKGFRLDTRKSERGNNNIYKVTCNMQFSHWDIFQVICASDLRQFYDLNLDISRNIVKIAANTYVCQ